jgi:hypothetical protein
MITLRKIVRWTLDVLTVLTAVFLVNMAINWYIQREHVALAVVSVFTPGSTFDLPGIKGNRDQPTLIMALQSGCPYCEASMSFYRDILRSNSKKTFRVIALLPQSTTAGQAFMHQYLGQDADGLEDVRQVDLESLNIRGTPTLIVVSNSGRVESSWRGQLSSKQEADVFRALGVHRIATRGVGPPDTGADDNLNANLITPDQFGALRNQLPGLPIVDIDPRPIFAKDHIVGALNIPVDELEARIVHEVPVDGTVVVYCGYCPPCERPSEKANSTCWMGSLILREQGFKKARFLTAPFSELGTKVVRSSTASN